MLAQRSIPETFLEGRHVFDFGKLIPLIDAGEESALDCFYEATSGLLFGLILLMVGDTAAAERVLSAVYAEVKQHPTRFERTQESLLAWLVTIAHRRALEQLCRSGEDQRFLVSVGLANPAGAGHAGSAGISRSAHRRLVAATLNSISPSDQKLVELSYFSRMTISAIASRLGVSDTAVKSGLEAAITRLYKLFQSQDFRADREAGVSEHKLAI